MNPVRKLIQRDREIPCRIMVVGDGMTDVYVQGRMEGCQERCTKFVQQLITTVPGGADNAKRSLNSWFAGTRCMSDIAGGRRKTRFMVDSKCIFRYDQDESDFDLNLLRREVMIKLDTFQPEGVLLSDYDKGLLTPDFIRQVVNYCVNRYIPCVADVKREPALYKGAIIKANKVWGDKYRNQVTSDTTYIETHGELYPIVCEAKEEPTTDKSNLPNVKCVNHVGAGDCFAAHLILSLANKLSLKEAVAVAHSAGRVYVQCYFNEPPQVDRIESDYLSGTQ